MSKKIYHYARADVLAQIQQGPTRRSELLRGAKCGAAGKRLRAVLDALARDGAIEYRRIGRVRAWVVAGWEPSDEYCADLFLENCRQVGDCLVWSGYICPDRGPLGYSAGKTHATVRRTIWRAYHDGAEAPKHKVVRAQVDCEDGCCNPEHLRVTKRGVMLRGVAKPVDTRMRIARSKRALSKNMTMEKARAIRAAEGTQQEIAQQFGVSKALVGQVRRGEVWREHFGVGMFDGLVRLAA